MVELMIEHWSQRDGSEEYLWSVWDQGKRMGMGRPQATPDEAEREGRAWCKRAFGTEPDRVTRL